MFNDGNFARKKNQIHFLFHSKRKAMKLILKWFLFQSRDDSYKTSSLDLLLALETCLNLIAIFASLIRFPFEDRHATRSLIDCFAKKRKKNPQTMSHWVARIACANWNFIQNKIATPFNNFSQHISRSLELIRHRTTAWIKRIQPTANHVLQTLLCLSCFFSLFTFFLQLLQLVFFWLNPLLSVFFGCIPFVHSRMLLTVLFST